MESPICCPLRVDTFLAVTKVKPVVPEAPRITAEEKKKLLRELEECFDMEVPEDFWD